MFTYQEAINYIQSFKGSKFGLDRIISLCNAIGNPQKKLQFVHVAGTNGKGSTVTMLANTLINAGYKVGVFSSPYMLSFEEQISINGKWISQEDLIHLTIFIKQHIDKMPQDEFPSEFEIVTAIAFQYFLVNSCNIVVLECGLGGRLDSTNVIDTPLCSIITKISMDHTDFLGNTLESIAFEKAGIIKNNSVAVSYGKQEAKVLSVFEEQAKLRNSNLIVPILDSFYIENSDSTGSFFYYENQKYQLSLIGSHQCLNAVTVIEAVNVLIHKGFCITLNNLKDALLNTKIPARLEILSWEPIILLDAAHNPDGFNALVNALDTFFTNKPLVTIMGMLLDKDYNYCVSLLAKRSDALFTVAPNNPRALDADTLAHAARLHCNCVNSYKSYEDAFSSALDFAKKSGIVVICGSLYMAGAMRNIILKTIDK